VRQHFGLALNPIDFAASHVAMVATAHVLSSRGLNLAESARSNMASIFRLRRTGGWHHANPNIPAPAPGGEPGGPQLPAAEEPRLPPVDDDDDDDDDDNVEEDEDEDRAHEGRHDEEAQEGRGATLARAPDVIVFDAPEEGHPPHDDGEDE